MTPGADALVVGGGVIGRAVALALAERGASVELIDASAGPGRGPASLAAAGILGAQMEAHADSPLFRLCLESRDRFEAFARRVEALADAEVEYRRCGVTVTAVDEARLAELERSVAWQREAHLAVTSLDAADARALEPALGPDAVGAVHFPDDARVDPRALMTALDLAARAKGVRVRASTVRRILRDGAKVRGVEDEDGPRHAKQVILCAGSWSALVTGTGLSENDVVPARGQILELTAPPGTLRGVVLGPDAYLSPRDDGRILVGSTVELVGFDARVTAQAARDLLAGALALVPSLAAACLTDSWAGLRPRSPDELPLLGEGVLEGLIVATAHFRNGVLLAPITAEIVTALACGRAPALDISAFSPSRFARFA